MTNYRQPFKGTYPITQAYGELLPGVTVNNVPHTGIDYACPPGTPILASADGRVVQAGWDPTGYGYCVILYHADGRGTLYAHLKMTAVKAGTAIKQGEILGYSGATGNCTGPHLHFEARKNWTDYKSHFDPMTLPLMSFDDSQSSGQSHEETVPAASQPLKGPMQLGEAVQIVAPAGAWGWNADFSRRVTVYPEGTQLHFTGRTTERLGYVYCECYPEPAKYWVAVHDGETQILDNAE